jgi:hypothetical protein
MHSSRQIWPINGPDLIGKIAIGNHNRDAYQARYRDCDCDNRIAISQSEKHYGAGPIPTCICAMRLAGPDGYINIIA